MPIPTDPAVTLRRKRVVALRSLGFGSGATAQILGITDGNVTYDTRIALRKDPDLVFPARTDYASAICQWAHNSMELQYPELRGIEDLEDKATEVLGLSNIRATAIHMEETARYAVQGSCAYASEGRDACGICTLLRALFGKAASPAWGVEVLIDLKQEVARGHVVIDNAHEFTRLLAQRIGMNMRDVTRVDHGIEAVAVVDTALNSLLPRQQEVLQIRCFEHMTLKQVGKKLGVKEERVRQVEAKALRNLRLGPHKEQLQLLHDYVDMGAVQTAMQAQQRMETLRWQAKNAFNTHPTLGLAVNTDSNREILTEVPAESLTYADRILVDLACDNNDCFAVEREAPGEANASTDWRLLPYFMTEVDTLELSVRSANCLQNAGVRYIVELLMNSEQDLLKIENFGRKAINEIKNVLSELAEQLGVEPILLGGIFKSDPIVQEALRRLGRESFGGRT